MSVTDQNARTKDGFWETIKVVVEALLLALVVRTFLFQPFSIPSGSMMHTLLVGDYLFVSKYSYGYSKYSFPFGLGPFEGRLWASAPKAGDIVVFKLPADHSTDYIKRVIGLPGDRVQMKGGVLYINGVAVKRELTGDYTETGPFGTNIKAQIYRETLPNGVSYDTLDMGDYYNKLLGEIESSCRIFIYGSSGSCKSGSSIRDLMCSKVAAITRNSPARSRFSSLNALIYSRYCLVINAIGIS